MLAHEIAVVVDHLGLEPEPELQAPPLDVVDEREQALRPHVARHDPVTEGRTVVATTAEPSVVEHEPLHADTSPSVGQGFEVVEVGLEVDGLPGVEGHRSRAARVVRSGPKAAVQAPREPVEALGRVNEDDGGGDVRLARFEPHLTGREQLAAADHRVVATGTLGQRLHEMLMVAAPRRVHGPHLTGAPAEAAGAGHHQQRGVVAGAPAPTRSQVGAVVERAALG